MKTSTCEWCESVFTRKTARRFCTPECWYRWTREKSKNLNPIHTCKHCQRSFTRRFKGRKAAQFCSPKCHDESRRAKRPICVCRACGVQFAKRRSDSAGAYCSRACCLTKRYGYVSKREKVGMPGWRERRKSQSCKLCGVPFTHPNQTVFCSKNCAIQSAYMSGGLDYRIRGFIVTVKRKGELCCERCEDKNPHHLTVHHRDGDHENNTDDNLETLCANCHFEIHWTDRPSREHRLRRVMQIISYLPGQMKPGE